VLRTVRPDVIECRVGAWGSVFNEDQHFVRRWRAAWRRRDPDAHQCGRDLRFSMARDSTDHSEWAIAATGSGFEVSKKE
jgi:hypothetical protein